MTAPQPGQPVVFRNATVLTMDNAHTILSSADVLVSGETIAAVGPGLEVPAGAAEIGAAGGIVMPGMIDTHRHMWQTAMPAPGSGRRPGNSATSTPAGSTARATC